MENKEDMLQVGIVIKPHGVHGEFKVFPTTDDIKRFDELKEAFLETKKGLLKIEIEGVKYFKQTAILKIKEFDSLESVDVFRSCPILVTRDNAVKLKPGECFIADLIDMDVYDESDNKIGYVKDVLQTGANDVYCIDINGKELLLPAIPECIINRDIKNKILTIHILDGLMDLN